MSKGQVDAPIELFVAVIILAMSMTLAFYVMNTSSEAQCIAELRSEVRSLESAMVDVAIGSPPTSREATFNMKSCGTKRIEGLRFVKYTQVDFCRQCTGYTQGCWKIEPVYIDSADGILRPLTDASMCIQMPMDMGVEDEYIPKPPQGYLVNPSNIDTIHCIPLGTTACVDLESGRSCSLDVPQSVLSDQYWRTLGRVQGESVFVFKLTKRLYLGTTGITTGQKGYISVCAMKKETAASR
ncbi:MAG: hypothetical protein NTY90_02325 [Candidatus Micrarchaeota archaeon]|nr:hypothetical protein [Candidatus Micrarchaeota archaeon]